MQVRIDGDTFIGSASTYKNKAFIMGQTVQLMATQLMVTGRPFKTWFETGCLRWPPGHLFPDVLRLRMAGGHG